MAADSSNILREYLISLGYKVNQQAQNKFIDGLNKVSAVAGGAGKAALAAATALGTMAVVYAHSMEKMYYASRFSGASGANLAGLSAGFRSIGLSGEGAIEAIKRFALLLQTPGIKEQLNGLGVRTTGRDTADIFKDALKRISKIADSDWTYGSGLAQRLLGLSPEDFQTIRKNLDTFFKAEANTKRNLSSVGVNSDALNKQAKEFEQLWRNVWDKIDAIGIRFTAEILPMMRDFVKWVDKILDPILELLGKTETNNPEAVKVKRPDGTVGGVNPNRIGSVDDLDSWLKSKGGPGIAKSPGEMASRLGDMLKNSALVQAANRPWEGSYSLGIGKPSGASTTTNQPTTNIQNNTISVSGVATTKDIVDLIGEQIQDNHFACVRVLSPKVW